MAGWSQQRIAGQLLHSPLPGAVVSFLLESFPQERASLLPLQQATTLWAHQKGTSEPPRESCCMRGSLLYPPIKDMQTWRAPLFLFGFFDSWIHRIGFRARSIIFLWSLQFSDPQAAGTVYFGEVVAWLEVGHMWKSHLLGIFHQTLSTCFNNSLQQPWFMQVLDGKETTYGITDG